MRKTHLFDTNQGKKFTNQSSPRKRGHRGQPFHQQKKWSSTPNIWQFPKMVGFPNNPWGFPYIKMISTLGCGKIGETPTIFFGNTHLTNHQFSGEIDVGFSGWQNLRFTPIFVHIFLTTATGLLGLRSSLRARSSSSRGTEVRRFCRWNAWCFFGWFHQSQASEIWRKKTSDCLPSFLGVFRCGLRPISAWILILNIDFFTWYWRITLKGRFQPSNYAMRTVAYIHSDWNHTFE